jgi:diamine N-acetyltransferase
MTNEILVGDKVSIRPITLDDTNDIIRWRNSDFVRSKFIYRRAITKEMHEKWLRDYVFTGNVIQFIIEDNNNKIGSVYLRDIDNNNLKAEFGIFIGDFNNTSKGYGREATFLILRYAFNTLKLNKVFLRVLTSNYQAIKSYEKVGFIKEGIAREDVIIDGEKHDILFMSILSNDFKGC